MENFYLISGETLSNISNLIKHKSGLDTNKTIPFVDIGKALLKLESGIYKELFEKKVTQKNITLNWSGVPPYSFSYVEGIDSLTFTSPYLTIDEGAFKGIQLDKLSFNLSEDQEFILSHTFENAIIKDFNYDGRHFFYFFGDAAFKNSTITLTNRGLFPRQAGVEAFKDATINSENHFYLSLTGDIAYGNNCFENFKASQLIFEMTFPKTLSCGKDAFKNAHVDHLTFVYPVGLNYFLPTLAECEFPTLESSPFNITADIIEDNAWFSEYLSQEIKIIKKYTFSNFPFQDSAEGVSSLIDMSDNQLEEIQEKGLYCSTFESPLFGKLQKIGSQAFANARTNIYGACNTIQIGSQDNPVYSIASDAFLNIQIPDIIALQIYYDNRIFSKEDIPEDYDYEFLDGKWVPSGATTLWGIGPEYIDILNLEWIPAFQEEE